MAISPRSLRRLLEILGLQVPKVLSVSLHDFHGYLGIMSIGHTDPEVSASLIEALKSAGITAKIESRVEGQIASWYDNQWHVIVGRR